MALADWPLPAKKARLARVLERLGGISTMLLSHHITRGSALLAASCALSLSACKERTITVYSVPKEKERAAQDKQEPGHEGHEKGGDDGEFDGRGSALAPGPPETVARRHLGCRRREQFHGRNVGSREGRLERRSGRSRTISPR